jgi:hypothetical protein
LGFKPKYNIYLKRKSNVLNLFKSFRGYDSSSKVVPINQVPINLGDSGVEYIGNSILFEEGVTKK